MDSPAVFLPRVTLTAKQFSGLKDCKVGSKCTIEMEVELVSLSKNEYGNTDLTGTFKVHKVNGKTLASEEQMMAQRGRM